MKLLYVSESLAENTHPRGIFTFSSNILEAIAADGWEVYLLTDSFRSTSIARRLHSTFPTQSLTLDAAAAASHIHNYGKDRSRSVGMRLARIFRLCRLALSCVRVFTRMGVEQSLTLVPINAGSLEFLPEKTSFLKHVRGLAVAKRPYRAAKVLGSWGIKGPRIDASEFDLVLIDSPANIRIKHSHPNRVVQIVHDLLPLTDPTHHSLTRNIFGSAFSHMLEFYDQFIFVSNFTKNEFQKMFPQKRTNALVYYPRVKASVTKTPQGSSAGPRVVALIVSDEYRKNIKNAIEAAEFFAPNTQLCIVGQIQSADYRSLIRTINRGTRKVVVELGYVSETHKRAVIESASCVLVPSFAEGFGLPIAEAMLADTPVACSDIPLFHEVAGAAAEYFDPTDPASIAGAVNRVCARPRPAVGVLSDLAKKYSSETAATELYEFLQDAVGHGKATQDDSAVPTRRRTPAQPAPATAMPATAAAVSMPLSQIAGVRPPTRRRISSIERSS